MTFDQYKRSMYMFIYMWLKTMIASTCVENTGTIYGMQLEQVRFWTSKVGEENLKTQSDYMKEEGPQQGSAAW